MGILKEVAYKQQEQQSSIINIMMIIIFAFFLFATYLEQIATQYDEYCPLSTPRSGDSCNHDPEHSCYYEVASYVCCGQNATTTSARCINGRWRVTMRDLMPCDKWTNCMKEDSIKVTWISEFNIEMKAGDARLNILLKPYTNIPDFVPDPHCFKQGEIEGEEGTEVSVSDCRDSPYFWLRIFSSQVISNGLVCEKKGEGFFPLPLRGNCTGLQGQGEWENRAVNIIS